jgi:hypothetical protein
MSFVVYKGEKRIGDLVTRAYGELKAEDAKRAEAALRKANPQLARLRELKPGAVVVVPPVVGLKPPAATERGEPAPESVAVVRAAFEEYRKQLGASLDAERAAIAAITELAKSREVRQLAKDAPESTPYLEQAAGALKQRSTEADQAAGFVKLLAKARADLDALAKRLGDGS